MVNRSKTRKLRGGFDWSMTGWKEKLNPTGWRNPFASPSNNGQGSPPLPVQTSTSTQPLSSTPSMGGKRRGKRRRHKTHKRTKSRSRSRK